MATSKLARSLSKATINIERASKAASQYKTIKPKPLVLIPKGYEYLSISVDTDDPNFDNIKKWVAVLLVGESEDHRHVALSQKKARQLRDWLNEFLKQTK